MTLDNENVHLVAIPTGFEFLVFAFHNPHPMAVLRRNAKCKLSDKQVAAILRGCAAELDAGTVKDCRK